MLVDARHINHVTRSFNNLRVECEDGAMLLRSSGREKVEAKYRRLKDESGRVIETAVNSSVMFLENGSQDARLRQ